MSRRLFFLAFCILGISVLSAQVVDKTVSHAISEYFRGYKSDRTSCESFALDRRKNNIVVNGSTKVLTIHVNEPFSWITFTPDVVDGIYRDVRGLLPDQYADYEIRVVHRGVPIDDLVPNILRPDKRHTDNSRLWGKLDYKGAPWVNNVSRPNQPKLGLQGRHIALWQSHGRYFNSFKGEYMWAWQRPPLFCTTEDLFTQSIVVPFLMPMLENAGALVYTPRERDWQPNCVIVDNDKSDGKSRYAEHDTPALKWGSESNGYAPAKAVYHDFDDPFSMGTSRVISSTTVTRRKANAVWIPDIPEDGYYAVYVSYETFANSVSKATYIVKHSGGETEFKVNQKMGGGTWVYLGTYHFRAGVSDSQGVVLSNYCTESGVVSADAVRFGGGMGNVARGPESQTSGLPRYLEAARYNLQTGGFHDTIYSKYKEESDYRDDINCRPAAVNYLSGGSVYNPGVPGLGVPLELSFGFHSDAGISHADNIVGTLGVVTTERNGSRLAEGRSRKMSRDAVSFLLNQVQDDLTARYGKSWTVRGILDRSYCETRVPDIPSVIFESLSHQNFIDMKFGHDPDFKFTMARAVYKALLKHLCYVHGKRYVVQPLPVTHFSLSFSKKRSKAVLKWRPQEDKSEPTAVPESYIVYKSVNGGGYDNGTVVDKTTCAVSVDRGVLYSFKVAAVNDGGESLPSEELSLYIAADEKSADTASKAVVDKRMQRVPDKVSGSASVEESDIVLVVNGFHRLSGPATKSTKERVGFELELDPGVPYKKTPEYCGEQLDTRRENIGFENGLGFSGSEYEGKLLAGNEFNYPYVHGKSLMANGISFVSCSSEAVMCGDVKLTDYKVVDLILGVEKQGGDGSLLHYNQPYKTFPKKLRDKVAAYCRGGGNLFVSGAFIASDMRDGDDKRFIREVLHYDYGGSVTDLSETLISGSGLRLSIGRKLNEQCYAVASPDILVPLNDAFVSFVFDDSKQSAGVAYDGDTYRTLSTSFPFEAVRDEKLRDKLMGAIMRFLMP